MPLSTPTPPTDAAAAFTNGLPAFLTGPGGLASPAYVGAAPDIPTAADVNPAVIHSPQHVFVLTLTDAANTTGVISPRDGGWRFFAGPAPAGPAVAVMGRVIRRSPSHPWKLVAVHYGDLPLRTLNQSLDLFGLPFPPGNYELRVLSIPGLNQEWFWFAALAAGSVDQVFPVPQAAITITGVETVGTNTITGVGAVSASWIGYTVSGSGIPAGTVVTGVSSLAGGTLTVSNLVTLNGSYTITLTPPPPPPTSLGPLGALLSLNRLQAASLLTMPAGYGA